MSEAFVHLVKRLFPRHRPLIRSRSPTPNGILTPTSQTTQTTQSPQTPSYLFTKHKNLFEEEHVAMYVPGLYYPVEIGERITERYTVIGKLGYGQHSTVWLCSDAETGGYIALKIFKYGSPEATRELVANSRLWSQDGCFHTGGYLVRRALQTFEIHSEGIPFQCLVFQPLGITLYDFQLQCTGKIVSPARLRTLLTHLLLSLDYLHSIVGVIHNDIRAENILLGIKDISILNTFEAAEKTKPSIKRMRGDRVLYETRKLQPTTDHDPPVLCDFGQAQLGLSHRYTEVERTRDRAPEILLLLPWNEKVDIWHLGLLTLRLRCPEHLFWEEELFRRPYSDAQYLAQMIALLGPPPMALTQGTYATRFFDSAGNWKSLVPIPTSLSLENFEQILGVGVENVEDERLFLSFLRKMLTWDPRDRFAAIDLLSDPWMLIRAVSKPVDHQQRYLSSVNSRNAANPPDKDKLEIEKL